MHKPICFLLLLTLPSLASFGQSDSLIGYQGGLSRLNKVFLDALDRGVQRYHHDEGKWHDLHFLATFEVSADGAVGPVVSVVADNDSSLFPRIRTAISVTSGKWINHTGEPRTIVLPINIHYVYDDPRYNQADTLRLYQESYDGGVRKKVIYLKPITIESGPVQV
jgi:hypothetical protein